MKKQPTEILRKFKTQVRSTQLSPTPETAHSSRLLTKLVQFGTVGIRTYSVGYLAMSLNRSTATIRRWQRKGIIQPPLIKTSDGARWYMKEEIDLYVRLVKDHNLQTGNSIEDSGFPVMVKQEAEKLRRSLVLATTQKGTPQNENRNSKKG